MHGSSVKFVQMLLLKGQRQKVVVLGGVHHKMAYTPLTLPVVVKLPFFLWDFFFNKNPLIRKNNWSDLKVKFVPPTLPNIN